MQKLKALLEDNCKKRNSAKRLLYDTSITLHFIKIRFFY